MTSSTNTDFWRTLVKGLAVFSVGASVALSAQDFHSDRDKHGAHFWPGNLVVSRSVYDNNPSNVKVGTILSPNCANTTGGCAAATGAPYNGAYPLVWNNDTYDASFGITSKIVLDQITPWGALINTLEVPNSSQHGTKSTSDQLATSFSSKSELALNLSNDTAAITDAPPSGITPAEQTSSTPLAMLEMSGSSAERSCPGSRRADNHTIGPDRMAAESRPADAGRQLLHHATRSQS